MMRRTRRMPKRKLPKKPNKSKAKQANLSDEVTILDFYSGDEQYQEFPEDQDNKLSGSDYDEQDSNSSLTGKLSESDGDEDNIE